MESKNSKSDIVIRKELSTNSIHLPKFKRLSYTKILTPNRLHRTSIMSYKKNSTRPSEIMSMLDRNTLLSKNLIYKPFISASSWIVVDNSTGNYLDGKNEDSVREIASLTKIMTCITAIIEVSKRKRSYEEVVCIKPCAAKVEGTSASLETADEIKLWDLLHGLMLPSGNDAAVAIAEFIGNMIDRNGDPIENFINRMNYNAIALKLTQTSFSNPHGMSTSLNTSTARDIAALSFYANKNSIFNKIVNTKKYTCKIYNPAGTRKIEWINTNLLLNRGFSGLKTGCTPAAGPCLSFSIKKDKKGIIGVLLNSRSPEIRWSEASKLWKYCNQLQ